MKKNFINATKMILSMLVINLFVLGCNSRTEKNPESEETAQEQPQNQNEPQGQNNAPTEDPQTGNNETDPPVPLPPSENPPTPPTSEELLAAVRAIINERCISCHGSDSLEDLSTVAGIMFYVTPGSLEGSELWTSLKNNGGTMPRPRRANPIPDSEAQIIKDWILSLKPN